MTPPAALRDGFFQECEELLESLGEGLAALQAGGGDAETVNAVFRAVHSIKGGAGAFGFHALVAFAHEFETVLDAARSGRADLDAGAMAALLRCADHLADHVEGAAQGEAPPPEATRGYVDLLRTILAGAPGAAAADEGADDGSWGLFGGEAALAAGFAPVPIDLSLALAGEGTEDEGPSAATETAAAGGTPALLIRFAPYPALYDNGHDPALLLEALADLGRLQVTADLSRFPRFEDYDPRYPALAWDAVLETTEGEMAAQEVFEFVHGLCDLDIRAAGAPARAAAAAAPAVARPDPVPPPSPPRRPAIPLSGAVMWAPDLPEATPDREARPEAVAPIAVTPEAPIAAPPEVSAHAQAEAARGPRSTLRVDLERVDRLINGVGELIVNQAMLAQALVDRGLGPDDDLVARAEDYRLLARDVQEAVMAIRAQSVKPLFQRMSRTLRDAADATGKPVELDCAGEATEVDKTVIERLADPLTHLVRNAVDHGIEDAGTRRAAGKPEAGTIRLTAAHRSGAVIITVADDGAGLDRDRILAKARARGLIEPGAEPSEAEVHALLFLPGFSTAGQVSALSGRGVGLDVVRTAVTALGGRISVASLPGRGTEFTIQLPLTLAVMDGMIVSIAGQTMVVPLTAVLETVRPAPGDLHRLGPGDRALAVRGEVIPIIDTAAALGFPAIASDAGAPLLLVVEAEDRSQWAFAVDAVHDQRQVVIKGLEGNFGQVPGVSAATVLGDGRIALILDSDALTARARAAAGGPAAIPPPSSHPEPSHVHG